MEQGQFQVYTGDGKGKTTAAAGLALRALGAGKRVYLGQFIKDMEYHEIPLLRAHPNMTVVLYGSGRGCLLTQAPQQEDLDAAESGFRQAREALLSGDYDLVILDEISVAWALELLPEQRLLELADCRKGPTELVFTGRYCPQSVLDRADLITEMREVRHYYADKGLLARDGIER